MSTLFVIKKHFINDPHLKRNLCYDYESWAGSKSKRYDLKKCAKPGFY